MTFVGWSSKMACLSITIGAITNSRSPPGFIPGGMMVTRFFTVTLDIPFRGQWLGTSRYKMIRRGRNWNFRIQKLIGGADSRSEEHTSELQSHLNLVCRLLLEKKKRGRDRACGRS